MKLIYLLSALLATFLVAFATSALLDLPWIQQQPIREFLIYALMFLEVFTGLAVMRFLVKSE